MGRSPKPKPTLYPTITGNKQYNRRRTQNKNNGENMKIKLDLVSLLTIMMYSLLVMSTLCYILMAYSCINGCNQMSIIFLGSGNGFFWLFLLVSMFRYIILSGRGEKNGFSNREMERF